RFLDADDRLHRRRLAGAVGADQPQYLARVDAETDILDGDQAAEALGEAGDLEHGRAAHATPLRRDRRPRKPPGKTRTTTSAMAETTKVARSPTGLSASLAPIRNTAPSTPPMMVRRPPMTAATMI